MKIPATITLLICLVFFPINTKGDATIDLSNYESLMPIYFLQQGVLATGENIYIEVFARGPGGPWSPVSPIGTSDPIIHLKEPGYFDAGVGIIPLASDNSPVDIYVQAWVGPGPIEGAAFFGATASWDQASGSWNPASGLSPTGPSLQMSESLLITTIPEPSVLTLCISGALGLFCMPFIKRGTQRSNVK